MSESPRLVRTPAASAAAEQPAFAAAPDAQGTGAPRVDLFGEIHNAAALRRELGLPGHAPAEAAIAAGWHRWSAGLFSRLDGEFALALQTSESTLLYRDPSGLRNLFVRQPPLGETLFAPRLRPLADAPGPAASLSRPAIHEFLRLLEVAPPSTLVEGTAAVEPGQALTWRTGDTAPPAPLQLSGEVGMPPCDNFATAVDHVDDALAEGIHLRLRGALRPAAFLSGGIDSALICAIAARSRPDLVALTVGFDAQPYDEAPIAGDIACHLALEHRVLRFNRSEYLRAFERLSREADQPIADPAAMATLLAFDYCREHHDVVLDGTGADEAVGVMPPRHLRVAIAHASRLPRVLRQATGGLLRRTPRLAGYAPVFDYDHPADLFTRWHGFSREEIECLCGEPVSLAHTQFLRTFARFPRDAHFERYSALLDVMTCERLNQAMQISGATVRFPFWAPHLNRYIRQLRTDYRALPGQPKRILRALLARYAPVTLWDRPKHSFDFPLRAFLAEDDFMLVRRHLDSRRWHGYRVLEPDRVQAVADSFIAGEDRLTFRAWALTVLGAWLEHREPLWGTR